MMSRALGGRERDEGERSREDGYCSKIRLSYGGMHVISKQAVTAQELDRDIGRPREGWRGEMEGA